MTDTVTSQNIDLFSWDTLYSSDIYISYYCEILLTTYQTATCNMPEVRNLNITKKLYNITIPFQQLQKGNAISCSYRPSEGQNVVGCKRSPCGAWGLGPLNRRSAAL
jgi:hypothetical protein